MTLGSAAPTKGAAPTLYVDALHAGIFVGIDLCVCKVPTVGTAFYVCTARTVCMDPHVGSSYSGSHLPLCT